MTPEFAISSIHANSSNDKTTIREVASNNKDSLNANSNRNLNSKGNSTLSHKIFIKMFKESILTSKMKSTKMMANMKQKTRMVKSRMITQMTNKG